GGQSGRRRAASAACRLRRSCAIHGLSDCAGAFFQPDKDNLLSSIDSQRRVVSGMRPSGRLHLGHFHGVLKNWIKLQHEYECFFCIVGWHALTTDYEASGEVSQHVMDMAVDWLAAGVSPSSATLFIQ